MKSKLAKIILGLLVLLLPLSAFAAATPGSVSTPSLTGVGYPQPSIQVLTITVTAASDDGTVPTTWLLSNAAISSLVQGLRSWFLVSGEAIPGSTGLKTGTTYVIKNENGTTLLTITGSSSAPTAANFSYLIPVTENLSITVSGNDVNSGTQKIILYFSK